MTPILVTGAAGRVGGIGRTVTQLLLEQRKVVRVMVRHEDGRAQALCVWSILRTSPIPQRGEHLFPGMICALVERGR
jgi:nucleoside-diphosphate-sugar epimerase